MVNKIFGYILIIAGLAVIGWTLFQSYNIFTDKISAPLVFKTPAPLEKSESKKIADMQEQLQKQMEETLKQQFSQMLPADTLPKLLNLISWSILACILIFGGGQVAGIGAKMLK
ncbi:MAG: hypothetical protein HYT36_01895 [Candidatus Staskawiczbacteria bacterium]|nr:hypothetical protein [Candidatus Staskawiczbacteria bacterium]